jgi:hypothetical protein
MCIRKGRGECILRFAVFTGTQGAVGSAANRVRDSGDRAFRAGGLFENDEISAISGVYAWYLRNARARITY